MQVIFGGTLTFGGDAEINLNTRSNDQLKGQTKSPAYHQAADSFEKKETWGQDGRILFDIGSIKNLDNNYFAQIHVAPSVNMDGGFGADDAWFGFGQKNDWMFKVGHLEAYDLYPNGMDIFVDQAGNSADGSYSDERAYVYKANAFGFKNFDTYLGAYYSVFNPADGDNTDRLGGRVRFKYFF